MKYDPFFQFILAATNSYVLYPSKEFLILTIPAAIFGFCALLIVIIKLVNMFSTAEVCRFPLKESSEAEISQTGEMDVCLEVPMLTLLAGKGLDYELLNKRDGRTVELHRTAASLMSRNNGVKMTFVIRKCEIQEAGTYLLKVSGIDPQTDYSGYSLTISRPTASKSFFYIFGILLSALLFIGGLVGSLIISNASK